ncbi:SpaA isopeptide-forming pilin-related protein, partial [Levilactobacillus andaensis]|uniref:SpaA isopeptide-forming pilin-related protein n=1 Tax=Levilactobacillus andaensis TaxID=2799570 RepID=UPI001945698F
MRKKICALVFGLVLTLAIFLAGGAISGGITAKAADVPASGLTGSEATLTDINGNPIPAGTVLTKWTSYQIKYHWSVADGVPINSGDTVPVELPNGVATNHDLSVPLLDDAGNEVGTFFIKAGETAGTITFNDKLGSYQKNREGTLQFYAKGTSGNTDVDLSWKLNKVGWISERNADGTPSKITWNVAFNPTGQAIGQTVITDTLGPNQTYVPGSVVASTGSYSSEGNFISNGSLSPAVNVNGNKIVFTFADVSTAVNMTYQTTPTTSNGTWTNSVYMNNGQSVNGSVAWGGSGSGNGGNGSAAEGTGDVVLEKVDAKTNGILPGATYALQFSDGTPMESDLTTNAEGKLEVTGLEPGDYQFVETAAPEGYELDKTPIPFTITANQTAAVTVTAKDVPKESEGSTTPPVTEPENPGNPGTTTPPVTEPENPGTTTPPTGPVNPGNPGTTTPPTGPTNPENPGTTTPTTPEKPGTTTPTTPEKPGTTTPTTPEKPGTTTPTTPEKP